jgi:hypothetical protein
MVEVAAIRLQGPVPVNNKVGFSKITHQMSIKREDLDAGRVGAVLSMMPLARMSLAVSRGRSRPISSYSLVGSHGTDP